MKPEDDKDPPVVVPPGGEYKLRQDGAYKCCGDDCSVYKTVGSIDIYVNADGSWNWRGGNPHEWVVQACIGGCKDDDFLKKNKNWPSKDMVKKLCTEAKKKQEEDEKKKNPPPPPEKPS